MLTKILQAYRTAWYYPKAIGNSKTSTFVDRLLFLAIPLIIAITAFFSADYYVDPVLSSVLSLVILMVSSTLTVATTRSEYELVDHYLRKHKKLPLSSHPLQSTQPQSSSLDPYTQVAYEFVKATGDASTPILSEETGSWVGFGHTLSEEFVSQVLKTSGSIIDKPLRNELEDSIIHGYAVTYRMKDDPDVYLRQCPRDTPDAFPVTILPATIDLPTRTLTLAKIPLAHLGGFNASTLTTSSVKGSPKSTQPEA